jgi:hypothetical protein
MLKKLNNDTKSIRKQGYAVNAGRPADGMNRFFAR